MCPNCNKKSYCGCKACKPNKGLHSLRSFKFTANDDIKCPYCRKSTHIDYWYDQEYINNLKLQNGKY